MQFKLYLNDVGGNLDFITLVHLPLGLLKFTKCVVI